MEGLVFGERDQNLKFYSAWNILSCYQKCGWNRRNPVKLRLYMSMSNSGEVLAFSDYHSHTGRCWSAGPRQRRLVLNVSTWIPQSLRKISDEFYMRLGSFPYLILINIKIIILNIIFKILVFRNI